MMAVKPRRVFAVVAALAAVFGLGASCGPWWDRYPGKDDPRYCDPSTPCADSTQYCDFVKHECVGAPVDGGPDGLVSCVSDTECPDTMPLCVAPACRSCTPGTGGHALCLSRSSTTPFCDAASGGCRGCQTHSECGGACLPNGSCAPPGEVVFVYNGGTTPCSGTDHAGTSSDPHCQIGDALAAGDKYIVVTGSSAAYKNVSITGGTVWILGPRGDGTLLATITAAAGNAVSVTGTSTVALDGLDIAEASASGVDCSGLSTQPANLSVTRSTINNSSGFGVNAYRCAVSLDGNLITSNGGGIRLVSSAYTVTNNIIALNKGTMSTVTLDAASSGTFAFNTVVQNESGSVSNVDCGNDETKKKTIKHSIVWGNSLVKGTQLGPQCIFENVVTGIADVQGTQLDPTFESELGPRAFFLAPDDAENEACCVDKVANPATPNADHDVGYSHRPKGASWDIGAHEVQ